MKAPNHRYDVNVNAAGHFENHFSCVNSPKQLTLRGTRNVSCGLIEFAHADRVLNNGRYALRACSARKARAQPCLCA